MSSKSVLISGLGIAGPTLAYWLSERRYSPTIVERAPCPRAGGYVIDFWGRGYDVAERMGLLGDLRSVGYDIQELRLVDSHGRGIGGFGVDVFRGLTAGRYVSLPRSDLSRLIYGKIESRCEVIFDDSTASFDQDGDGVDVAFERAPARRFDLVVGADGLHSKVRELVFGGEEHFTKYLGYRVAAFEAEGYRPRDELVYVSHSVPGKQVARFALRDDRTLFLLIFAADRPMRAGPRDLSAQKAALRGEFDQVGWECPRILTLLDDCKDVYVDDVAQIYMDAWTRGRIALLGDAASCPSLLAGQGSALAMLAAYVLAGELGESGEEPQPGLQRYERRLRPFMTAKQKAAAQFSRSFAPKTPFGLFVRNAMTKALAIPLLAKLTLGRSLLDRFEMPAYPTLNSGSRSRQGIPLR
jgi:2-polyprenyl-6-methoxyphenol hydroxylase-like FAD-dependent oxidoreductase